jgi:NADP-dependent 3-hydroxy acid dehydrogenase YdfG
LAQQPRNLTGQVAAITGGARGIGRATAEAFIRQGMKVAIGDLDLDEAQRTADQLGAGTVAFRLDVTDRDSFEQFLDAAEDALGPVDVLVNNAGIMPIGLFEDEDDASTIRQVDINVHGVVTGTKLAIKRMKPRRRGHIVNIASIAGLAPGKGVATYVGTKHFVVGMSESVRLELRDTGVDVSTICPAPVQTELFSGIDAGKTLEPIRPDEVADAIVAALKVPDGVTVVPKKLGRIIKFTSLLPRRAQEGMAKLLGAEEGVLKKVDPDVRAKYEARAARSEPSVPADAAEAPEAEKAPA